MKTHETSQALTSRSARSETASLTRRLCLWAGIIGSFFFVLVYTIAGFLAPGYSAMREVISFLELGPTGWIQILNFILTGLLFVLFAWGVRLGMRPWRASGWLVVMTVMIALSGVGLIMAGLFPPDPPGTIQLSLRGNLHAISFTVAFLGLGIACLVASGIFLRTAGWRLHGAYSLLSGLFPIFAALGNLYGIFVAANASSLAVSATSSQLANGGLINRILVIVGFAWYVILASRMLIQSRGEGALPDRHD